jgi:phage terminase large subunit-like protein
MSSIKTLSKDKYVAECWSKVESYIYGVTDGTIQTNENIKLAVKRFKDDAKRADLDYRVEAVDKVFRFAYYIFTDENHRIVLEPFQCFILAALFGPYYKDTDERKYLYAFLFMGRKNGKTTFCSLLQLYFMLADGVTFPQSVLIASTQDQANDTSFKALREMVLCSPALSQRLEVQESNKIIFRDKKRYGWCKTVPALANKLEGLNPTSAIIDEIHTYKDPQKFNVIKNALGTKKNPMLFLISTAGFGKDSFCAKLVEAGRNVLRGISDDDRFFYMLYELEENDDYNDESTWVKANPALGTILNLQLFRDQFNTNKAIPDLLDDFITKRFNLFLEEQGEWIPSPIISKCLDLFTEDEIKDLPCYIGVDLSATRDLTSVVLLFDGGDKFYVKPYFFFVKDDKNNILRRGGISIYQWVKEGHIIECTTPTIDYELVKQYLFDFASKYKVKGLYFDPWHFRDILNVPSTSKGATLTSPDNKQSIWCVPVVPGYKNFDYPMRFTETIFFRKQIHLYPNKCLVWNFLNVVKVRDKFNGNIRPAKDLSKDAIDGVISLLNAFNGYLGINTNAAAFFMKALEKKGDI